MAKKLLLLNGICAFAIATYHGAAYGLSAMFEWTDRYMAVTVPNYDQIGSISYYYLLAIRQLDAFAVPGFIFISAYFIAFNAKGRPNLPWKVVRSRFQILIVPYLLWTAIRFILLRNAPDSIFEIISTYYYIILLLQFYLLAPLFIPIARKNWWLMPLIGALVEFSLEATFFLKDIGIDNLFLTQVRSLFPLILFPRRLFWFSFGLSVAFHQSFFTEKLSRVKWGVLAATIILGVLTMVEYQYFAQLAGQEWLGPSFRGVASRLYSIMFICCFLAFERINIPFTKQFVDLGGKSLGIYLANIPVVYVIAILLYRFLPWTLGYQFIYQAILITAGLGIPLLMMKLLRQDPFRKYYRYVFG